MAIVASDGPTDMPSIASGRSSTASSVVFSVSREIAYALEQRRVVALTLSAAASVSASFGKCQRANVATDQLNRDCAAVA